MNFEGTTGGQDAHRRRRVRPPAPLPGAEEPLVPLVHGAVDQLPVPRARARVESHYPHRVPSWPAVARVTRYRTAPAAGGRAGGRPRWPGRRPGPSARRDVGRRSGG